MLNYIEKNYVAPETLEKLKTNCGYFQNKFKTYTSFFDDCSEFPLLGLFYFFYLILTFNFFNFSVFLGTLMIMIFFLFTSDNIFREKRLLGSKNQLYENIQNNDPNEDDNNNPIIPDLFPTNNVKKIKTTEEESFYFQTIYSLFIVYLFLVLDNYIIQGYFIHVSKIFCLIMFCFGIYILDLSQCEINPERNLFPSENINNENDSSSSIYRIIKYPGHLGYIITMLSILLVFDSILLYTLIYIYIDYCIKNIHSIESKNSTQQELHALDFKRFKLIPFIY